MMKLLKGLLVGVGMLCVSSAWAADEGKTYSYKCDDGTQVKLAFPNQDNAIMYYHDELSLLTIAISGSGSRYVGNGWQWWGKGVEEANLSVLLDSEKFASDTGKTCKLVKEEPKQTQKK